MLSMTLRAPYFEIFIVFSTRTWHASASLRPLYIFHYTPPLSAGRSALRFLCVVRLDGHILIESFFFVLSYDVGIVQLKIDKSFQVGESTSFLSPIIVLYSIDTTDCLLPRLAPKAQWCLYFRAVLRVFRLTNVETSTRVAQISAQNGSS